MEQEFWIGRWKENKIGFHRPGVHPYLERYWSSIANDGGRILVPLCGKSEDLAWLARRGSEAVGADLSEIAARAFGMEQGLSFEESHRNGFTEFRSSNLVYYVGDFLELDANVCGVFELFYDRAALIALPPDMRPGYAAHLKTLLADGARGLLITLEYDTSQMDGPPFSVEEPELRSLFSGFQIQLLDAHDCLEEEPRFKERGVRWMREAVYSLT